MTDHRRIFVLPDIHGCNKTFHGLLAKIQLQLNDTVYLLGDYIDRGPDSKGVIETILMLKATGHDIRPVLGNHEDMLLKCLFSDNEDDLWYWLGNGGDTTLKSYGVCTPQEIDPVHIAFMKELPLYRLTPRYIFVHAGLEFNCTNPLLSINRKSMLWQRTKEADATKIGGRCLVTGHNIYSLEEIKHSINSQHIQLDNGCYNVDTCSGIGNLVALELNNKFLYIQENIDF